MLLYGNNQAIDLLGATAPHKIVWTPPLRGVEKLFG
jgi:hypothetical protein